MNTSGINLSISNNEQHIEAADIYFVFGSYDLAALKLPSIAQIIADCTDAKSFIVVGLDSGPASSADNPILLQVRFPAAPVNFNKITEICHANYPAEYDGIGVYKKAASRSRSISSMIKKVIKKH